MVNLEGAVWSAGDYLEGQRGRGRGRPLLCEDTQQVSINQLRRY